MPRWRNPAWPQSIAPKNCATARHAKPAHRAFREQLFPRPQRRSIHPAKAYWLMDGTPLGKPRSYGTATASLQLRPARPRPADGLRHPTRPIFPTITPADIAPTFAAFGGITLAPATVTSSPSLKKPRRARAPLSRAPKIRLGAVPTITLTPVALGGSYMTHSLHKSESMPPKIDAKPHPSSVAF